MKSTSRYSKGSVPFSWVPGGFGLYPGAELWALVWTLQLSKGKKVNIYTDSRYVFATLHVHGVLYQERGLLRANGKDIKN